MCKVLKTALISHHGKIMLKIIQHTLELYIDREVANACTTCIYKMTEDLWTLMQMHAEIIKKAKNDVNKREPPLAERGHSIYGKGVKELLNM